MATTQKRKTNKRNTKSTSKRRKNNKVYVDPAKALALCIALMVICFSLLFVAGRSGKRTLGTEQIIPNTLPPISQRFEEPKKTETEKKEAERTMGTEQTVSPKPEVPPKKDTTAQNMDNRTKGTEQTVQTNNRTKGTEQTIPPVQPKPASFNFPQAQNNAQLIFVFDDGGQNLSHLEKFLKLPFPFTVAVLPKLAHSKESAAKIRASGNELILHQPMQAVNTATNPGPGAITPEMDEDQIISTLFSNINEIGPIAGMNNHEGSLITADAEKMEIILKMISENGIYFLDSRTNSKTQVPYVANALGYSWYERNIFLDNEKTKENALNELKKGLAIANKNGSVIMIGHIWSADFLPAFLMEVYPELKAKGYTFSVVSKSNAQKY